MIKTEFMDIYEELSMLNEAKVDIERFINKFGEDTYDLFKRSTQRLKNKGISTDILYHVKHTDKKDLDAILYNLQNRTITKAGSLTELDGDYEYLGEDKGYKVYKINDVIASINLGAGTGWCISGRYGHYGEKNYTPAREEAEKHWDEYASKGIKFYFFIGPKDKVALALYPKVLSIDKFMNGEYFDKTNIELYNEQDQLDYSLFDKLPVSLIKEELIVKIQAPENSMIIYDNRLRIVSPDVEYLVIPKTVTQIEFGAIRECKLLKTVTFEEGSNIKEIEEYTFNNCTSLSTIVLPNSLTTIKFAAFGGCSSLTNITIPESVTTIEEKAFARCDSLTSIVIPKTVTSLGAWVFIRCTRLKNIYCEAESKPSEWNPYWNSTMCHTNPSIEWGYKE